MADIEKIIKDRIKLINERNELAKTLIDPKTPMKLFSTFTYGEWVDDLLEAELQELNYILKQVEKVDEVDEVDDAKYVWKLKEVGKYYNGYEYFNYDLIDETWFFNYSGGVDELYKTQFTVKEFYELKEQLEIELEFEKELIE